MNFLYLFTVLKIVNIINKTSDISISKLQIKNSNFFIVFTKLSKLIIFLLYNTLEIALKKMNRIKKLK